MTFDWEATMSRIRNAPDAELGDTLKAAYEDWAVNRPKPAGGLPTTPAMPGPNFYQAIVRALYLDENGFEPSGRVLDIGCAHGNLVVNLALDGCEAHGVDVRADLIGSALTLAKSPLLAGNKPEFKVALGEALPYPDKWFDAIFATELLEHIRDLPRFVTELRRALKDGGRLFLTTPIAKNSGSFDHLHIFESESDIIAVLNGFRSVDIKRFRAFPHNTKQTGFLVRATL